MDNAAVIRQGFARLASSKESRCLACLTDTMRRAMAFALSAHDNRHSMHATFGDNYGWAVYHDGKIREYGINAGKGGESRTLASLRAYSSRVGSGWAGILLADMQAEGRSYYSISYERAIMASAVQFTRDNFGKYFTAA